MASVVLAQEDLKSLEQTRQRLFQLTNGISSLKASINSQPVLPPWSSLAATSSILAGHLSELSRHLSTHSDTLAHLVSYPQPNFPGRTQEHLLLQLLRKKREPRVEDWVELGAQLGSPNDDSGLETTSGGDNVMDTEGGETLEELWQLAKEWSGQRIAMYAMEEQGDDYTAEEREVGIENVRTGLKDNGHDEIDESDDENDDDNPGDGNSKGKDVGQAQAQIKPVVEGRSVDELMGLVVTGRLPPARAPYVGGLR